MTNPLDLSAQDFKELDPQALCAGILDGCDGYRINGDHADIKNPYPTKTSESKSYYIGYVKALSTLHEIIHNQNGPSGREDHARHDPAPEGTLETREA